MPAIPEKRFIIRFYSVNLKIKKSDKKREKLSQILFYMSITVGFMIS